MLLSGISVAGYRSFSEGLELELRPLTLLYGRNNAGKSAILRLLPIIGASVADGASSPFDVRDAAGPGAGFLDAINSANDLKRVELTLEWTDETGVVSLDRFILKYIDEIASVIVQRLEILDQDHRPRLRLDADPYPDHEIYRMAQPTETTAEIRPRFEGLVPTTENDLAELADLRLRLVGLRHKIQWLKSVRARWDRLVARTGNRYRAMDADGAQAAEILLNNDRIRSQVAAWYRRPEIGRLLEVQEQSRRYRILLSSRTSAHQIDLLDTGEGMIQVLPVLVACGMARVEGAGALLAVEEPESHLHGNAQQALAEHLCEMAGSENPPTILAETHSRILMLGVQLAIASGRVPPEQVCCYWVDQEESGESLAVRVDFDSFGRPIKGWPSTAFEEDQSLARRLLDQQLQGGAFS